MSLPESERKAFIRAFANAQQDEWKKFWAFGNVFELYVAPSEKLPYDNTAKNELHWVGNENTVTIDERRRVILLKRGGLCPEMLKNVSKMFRLPGVRHSRNLPIWELQRLQNNNDQFKEYHT